jgi:ABC-type phosphate transport system substrate-binding protein
MKTKLFSRVLGLTVLLVLSCPTFAEILVVVNPQNSLQTLSKEDVARMYLGKVKNFPNGSAVAALDQHKDSSVREEFYHKICDKSPSQVSSYWSRLIFTGKGVPPRALDSEAAVKEWVATHPDSIAYIDAAAVDASVKVILRVR